jgi:hypothetical protein
MGQLLRWIGVIAVFALSQGAPAATQIDATDFVLSYDETQVGMGLWGAPTVSNDSISFPNAAFSASTAGIPLSGGSFRFTLSSKNELMFDDFSWLVRGLYGVAASDDSATNQVTAGVTLRLLKTGSDVELGAPVSSVFDAVYLTTEITDAPWSLSGSLSDQGPLSQIDIEISNGLIASKIELAGLGSSTGGSGPDVSISTNFAEIQVSLVPLPPAALLFAGAMVAVGGFAQRRRASDTESSSH